jgi:hypothetical protein
MTYVVLCTLVGFYLPGLAITAIYAKLFLITRKRLRSSMHRTAATIEAASAIIARRNSTYSKSANTDDQSGLLYFPRQGEERKGNALAVDMGSAES